MSTPGLFLGPWLAEGCRDFLLLYACPRIAALPEILLLGAVTHHAGISGLGSLLGLVSGFLRHAKYSVRGVRWGRGNRDAFRFGRQSLGGERAFLERQAELLPDVDHRFGQRVDERVLVIRARRDAQPLGAFRHGRIIDRLKVEAVVGEQ
jgi:hypothetical protein